MSISAAGRVTFTALSVFAFSTAVRADQQAAGAPIERFNKVNERLYRGAQPTAAAFEKLRELGVKTVINLRMEPDQIRTGEKKIVEDLGMTYVSIPVEDGNFFTRSRTIPDEAIAAFFRTVDDPSRGPVFVHCHRGADRTGAIVAFYRIARQGWEAEKAFQEAREIGLRSWYKGLHAQIRAFTPAVAPANTGGAHQ
jgi:protein tyrosine/serine phosphatase